ncbi:MAG: hypothetical protein AVDCRST_MAG22-2432 [uncultured Rubrobacteraceae bacterium]|uniref:Uncharacterized protein n=1 Tax=uncultured Rubrobacteraceae bacterium TaxID=349277 RepID=A0A6J4PMS8_9ACTN|nr:MAG: hypothetical protein AVDCRST_MAG22-2432 [uncultured Rubrobacteraceae bacterium]
MISFDQQGTRFKYRVAGLAVHDGYVLLTKADQDSRGSYATEKLTPEGTRTI